MEWCDIYIHFKPNNTFIIFALNSQIWLLYKLGEKEKYIVLLFIHILPFLVFFILSCRSELPYGVISFYSEAFPLAFLITFPLLFKILWQTGARKLLTCTNSITWLSSGFSKKFLHFISYWIYWDRIYIIPLLYFQYCGFL